MTEDLVSYVRGRRAGPVRWLWFLAGVSVAALSATPLQAQNATIYSAAGVDGNETNILLIGGSVRPDGQGWVPSVSLQAYRLEFSTGVGDVTRWNFSPGVGLGYRMPQGAVEAKVSYNFRNDDEEGVFEAPVLETEGGGDGFGTSLQAQYWGGQPELQGIASYNWESEYLWTNAEGTYRVVEIDPGSISVGAEVVWQGELEGDDAYRSTSVGPLLKWSTGRESSVTLGTGWKDSNTRSPTWYLKVGFVRYGIGL